jgi:DNA modification methylase
MTDTNILVGDCRQILATLPEQSIQCVVTSPPYWGQRDYGVDGMIGLEADVQTWLAVMVDVFRGVRRVLRDDGTVWLNLGDKYAGSGGAGGDYNAGGLKAEQSGTGPSASTKQSGFKQKDLMGLPWRVALALQDDGWYLRRDIIWHKPNPMPESATDRPATAHEYIFLLTKQPRYFYDADAVRTITGKEASPENYGGKGLITHPTGPERKAVDLGSGMSQTKVMPNTTHPADASLRSVWKIATQAFGGAHYATYPEKLVEPCIKAGTSEAGECPECGRPWERVTTQERIRERTPSNNHGVGNFQTVSNVGNRKTAAVTTGWQQQCEHPAPPVPQTILDPFSGAGTTGLVAARFDRNYIGIELNPEYAEMSRKRIADRVGVMEPEHLDEDQHAQGRMF